MIKIIFKINRRLIDREEKMHRNDRSLTVLLNEKFIHKNDQ